MTMDFAKRAAAKLPDIARIPSEHREAFCEHAAVIIADTQLDIITQVRRRTFQDGGDADAAIFEETEQAAVDLLGAVNKLSIAQYNFLQAAIDAAARTICRPNPAA